MFSPRKVRCTCNVRSLNFLYRSFVDMFPHATLLDDDGIERKAIQRQISSLEESETVLAKRYGMVGIVDSVEVFDEAKRRAFANDAHSKKDLRELDRLNHLRLQLAHLRHSHTVPPPANNTP
ncbi:hypothetical protein ARMGADRAFT_1081244 [Armillaria gallica]|uniref:Uncharacterized protein n=1 Tax=Armillaria gallica TaxID=47427 RepID=A0A2H3DK12_ARMGA|nr:hypothetical protein ARMGADRAFT_1081244 [Armillaria gallica]